MGEILAFKRKKVSERHKGNTLCRSGFHKWQVVKDNRFEVRQGKLVTLYQCLRCKATKSTEI